MGFHDSAVLPEKIAYNSGGGPQFQTLIVETDSGAEQRIARRQKARRVYRLLYDDEEQDKVSELIKFFIARRGNLNGFRYKDFFDFSTAVDHVSAYSATDQILGIGDGQESVFQLKKRYTDGLQSIDRPILKPMTGEVAISEDDVQVFTGFSVNTQGQVTYTAPPAEGVLLKWGGNFHVPVRFNMRDEFLNIVQRGFEFASLEVELIEEVDPTQFQEELFGGGARNHGAITADVTLSQLDGVVQTFGPTSLGKKVNLPSLGKLPTGRQFLVLGNDGSQPFDVRSTDAILSEDDPTTFEFVTQIAPGETKVFHIGLDAGGEKVWVVT